MLFPKKLGPVAAEEPRPHLSWLKRHRMTDFINEETALRNASDVAPRGLSIVRAILPGWDVSTEGSTNPAAEKLVNRAAAWHIHLIVAGTHGWLGSRSFCWGAL